MNPPIIGTCDCGHTPDAPNRDCERCKLVWIVNRVAEMRAEQRAFFQTRLACHLERSRDLERLVDKGIARFSGGDQQELF